MLMFRAVSRVINVCVCHVSGCFTGNVDVTFRDVSRVTYDTCRSPFGLFQGSAERPARGPLTSQSAWLRGLPFCPPPGFSVNQGSIGGVGGGEGVWYDMRGREAVDGEGGGRQIPSD